jgi:aryl-alcohol dehydrogenase-like predicted oxidoreductase
MRAFDDLVRVGKVLYVGISDAPPWVARAYRRTGARADGEGPTNDRLARSSLRNGLLTGKYLPENVKQSEVDGVRMHSEMMKDCGSVEDRSPLRGCATVRFR